MPQGRRKVPFSGKKKKEQLIAKRQAKARNAIKSHGDSDGSEEVSGSDSVQKISALPYEKGRPDGNRFALQFHKESKKELALMREEAAAPFEPKPKEEREIDERYFEGYDFPKRPEWRYDMTKEELNRNEMRYFTEYVKKIEERHYEENKSLSVFELNLETWRQLWRVLELSDILLIIVDVRFASMIFPPDLYNFVTKGINKKVVLVLNKIDLVSAEVVAAWKEYFSVKYEGMPVVCFASYPVYKMKGAHKGKTLASVKFASEGAHNIYKEIQKLVGNEINITQWEQKILEDMETVEDIQEHDNPEKCSVVNTYNENFEFNFENREKYKDGILSIGCVGFPNVGKSSIINALKGRKVVSVSRTPGHTKHFQTIHLTENVRLCDCPGLVFPSSVPKHAQVILGSYPIAQLREPYTSIRYIGERIDLSKELRIDLPEGFEEWSAMAVCEAWAKKKGFFTAKASRPDLYRAANNILRMTLGGKVKIEFYPSQYFLNEDKWKIHNELETIKTIQFGKGKTRPTDEATNISGYETESEDKYSNEENYHTCELDELQNNQHSSNVFELLEEE